MPTSQPSLATRFLSRKFLMALGAQVAALIVLVVPDHGDQISDIVMQVTALAVSVLTALGYIATEGSVDREYARVAAAEAQAQAAAPSAPPTTP